MNNWHSRTIEHFLTEKPEDHYPEHTKFAIAANRGLALCGLAVVEHTNGNHTVWRMGLGDDAVKIVVSRCDNNPIHVSAVSA